MISGYSSKSLASMSTEQLLEGYLKVLLHEILAEGAIVISPRPGEFSRFEDTFLDGLKRIPSVIDAPAGVDPYKFALGHPGRWLMIWVPDKRR